MPPSLLRAMKRLSSLLLHYFVHLLSHVRNLRYKVDKAAIGKLDVTDIQKLSRSKKIAILVHGTWADASYPLQKWQHLMNVLGEQGYEIIRFRWDARNNEVLRKQAGRQLCSELNALLRSRLWVNQVVIVGHSHGGSVAMHSAKIVDFFASLSVITIGTPFVVAGESSKIDFKYPFVLSLTLVGGSLAALAYLALMSLAPTEPLANEMHSYVVLTLILSVIFSAALFLKPRLNADREALEAEDEIVGKNCRVFHIRKGGDAVVFLTIKASQIAAKPFLRTDNSDLKPSWIWEQFKYSFDLREPLLPAVCGLGIGALAFWYLQICITQLSISILSTGAAVMALFAKRIKRGETVRGRYQCAGDVLQDAGFSLGRVFCIGISRFVWASVSGINAMLGNERVLRGASWATAFATRIKIPGESPVGKASLFASINVHKQLISNKDVCAAVSRVLLEIK